MAATSHRPSRATVDWDLTVLLSLEDEFPFSDRAEIEKRIRRRLRRKRLGPYRPARVEELRRVKDFVQEEVGRQAKSSYWLGMTSRFVAMTDFDVERLTRDLAARHPRIKKTALRVFVPRAVFLYHLL